MSDQVPGVRGVKRLLRRVGLLGVPHGDRDGYPIDGRYVVRCDDGSVIAVDVPMVGDNVVLDRGRNW